MALHLGSSKVKINLSNAKYNLKFYSTAAITNGILLRSSEGYALKDKNGLYLTAKGDK